MRKVLTSAIFIDVGPIHTLSPQLHKRSQVRYHHSRPYLEKKKTMVQRRKKLYRRRRVRDRKDDESYTDWLLSKERQEENKVNLDGTNVYCPYISSKEFTLSTTNYDKDIFRLACVPESTRITVKATTTLSQVHDGGGDGSTTTSSQTKITKDDVWNVIMDFDNYSKWNPFQRHVRIMEEVEVDEGGEDEPEPPSSSTSQQHEDESTNPTTTNNNIIYEMDVVPFGKQVQEIFYVDEQRHIFIYGIPGTTTSTGNDNGPKQQQQQRAKSARCQWLTIEKVTKTKTTKHKNNNDEDRDNDGVDDDEEEEEVIMYHSMDCFLYGWQMYVIWLVPMLYSTILHKFDQQHAALKERVISMTKTRKNKQVE